MDSDKYDAMADTPASLRIGSLFSGVGGLDLAVEHTFNARTVWVSEIDPNASKILARRFAAPNLGDITTIDWDNVPRVDIITGGFPCQDVSAAGLRAGMTHGTRSGLWAHMAEGIAVLKPRFVVTENVRGLMSAKSNVEGKTAFEVVRDDLVALGYKVKHVLNTASAVGAPHKRERVFVLATRKD